MPTISTTSVAIETASEGLIDALVASIIRRGDSPHTRRAYRSDLRVLGEWLANRNVRLEEVGAHDLDDYREWLASSFARSTANRRLTVVRSLFAEAFRRSALTSNPAEGLRAVRGRDERDGGALTLNEARVVVRLLEAKAGHPSNSSRSRQLALRDLALVSLLIRTGLRRFEVARLRVVDMTESGDHKLLTIVRGKGNVTRTCKVPFDVWLAINNWRLATAEAGTPLQPDGPLFTAIPSGSRRATATPLSDRTVYAVVQRHLRAAGVPQVGPHGLRATFVTLALEAGAPLHLVQRAAGHADPRTTERYWRRKDSLDTNAVDFIHL